jgi:murein DD-endopeptidase MepM/ murein hydrolase activator NlpD
VRTSALFAAAAAIACAGKVHSQAQIPASIEFRVPKAPTAAAGDSGAFLAYELHVTNLTPAPVTLRRVEVLGAGSRRLELLNLSDSALLRTMTRPGLNLLPSERATLAGGTRANVFLWVPIDRDSPPRSVVHRLTLQRGDSAAFVLEGAATPVDPAPVRIGAPLRGEWLAANGPSNASGHRRTPLALNGTVAIAQRFGIDFLQVDSSDRTFRGDSTNNANYLAYGEEILAVGDGIVVATKDSIPENTPRSPVARAVPITLETVGGNHIVIDLGGGHYAFYAHVQPGSLRVRAGDRVRRGQVIALVGNSGNSTEPHLHFHIVDGIAAGTSTLGAEGLPYELASFDLDGRCSIGVTGVRCARERPTTVNRGMPLQNQLVRFRD